MSLSVVTDDTYLGKYKNKTLLVFRQVYKAPVYVKNNDNIIVLYAKDLALFELYSENNCIVKVPSSVHCIVANILVYKNGYFLNVRSKYNTFDYGYRYTYEDVLTLTKTSDRVIPDSCTKPIVKDIVISDKPSLTINNDITL